MDRIMSCVNAIRKITDFNPKIALVLGSGLGDFADNIDTAAVVDYRDIDSFPVSTVSGHNGRFVFGYLEGIPVVCMQGRIHYYEGYPMWDVVLPIRVMKLLGADILFLTNAAGGINRSFRSGDLMLIRDHISSFVPSPLVGANIDRLGVRFPDMSNVYNTTLCETIIKTAETLQIPLREGVYLQTSGPNYETPAEIDAFSRLGADAVGMSTACEAMAANHAGMRVCGISCISNMAAGISKNPLTHEEVKETAERVSAAFNKLVRASVKSIFDNEGEKLHGAVCSHPQAFFEKKCDNY